MPPEEEKSPLARAQERLYAPTGSTPAAAPALDKKAPPPPAERWTPPPPPPPKKPRLPRTTLFLIGAAVFFTGALIVAAGLILFGGRTVSNENIAIEVTAAPTAGSGDTVDLLITVANENPVPLSGTLLSIDFPEGTRSPENLEAELPQYSDTLGEIPAGGKAERTVRAVIFGAEGQRVSLPIRFEYRTPGASTAFIKEAAHEFTITTSPLSVSIGSLSQVSAGQPFDIAVAVRSNAAAPINNAALVAEYPPGFALRASTPAPALGSLYDLGTIQPGEEKIVRITGTIAGEDRETRVIRFTTGTRAEGSGALSVTYTTAEKPVVVEKPFLAPVLTLNREVGAALAIAPGEEVSGVLSFANTLDAPLEDAKIVVALSGTGLDPTSIRSANGFYRSADNTITFSKETIPALVRLAPGQTGSGSFTFATRPASAGLRNPTVNINISVSGRRINQPSAPTEISSTVTRTLKVRTDLAAAAQVLRSGPIPTTGPHPPRADTETSYAVKWTFTNSVNAVGGAVVSAVLPSYVRFSGAVSPSDAAITYNEATRTVTWNAGDVPAGASPKSASFGVVITPSASQRGTSPVLIGEASYGASDRFTGERIEGAIRELTNDLSASGGGTGAVQ
ncbi:MAG TPA: hypothetical protein VEA36_00650 [Candidatus Paceibacterota bacterium]|nr:hypothetical protein [Candidatus Paceibacterota bacterium]